MHGIKLLLLMLLAVPAFVSAKTYTMEIGQFEKLKVNGDINVIYKNLPDSTGFARYVAPEGFDNAFNITVKADGSLKVEPATYKWGDRELPTLYLYSDFLTSVESYSNQNVVVTGVAPCASFNVNEVGNGTITVDYVRSNNVTAQISTGNGSIYISGECVNAKFQMVGAGLISADQLRAENVKCRILGTGNIGCWPIDNLNVSGIGTTKIYYKGRPNIKKTGGGKLFELPEESAPRQGVEIKSFDLPERTVVTEDDD